MLPQSLTRFRSLCLGSGLGAATITIVLIEARNQISFVASLGKASLGQKLLQLWHLE